MPARHLLSPSMPSLPRGMPPRHHYLSITFWRDVSAVCGGKHPICLEGTLCALSARVSASAAPCPSAHSHCHVPLKKQCPGPSSGIGGNEGRKTWREEKEDEHWKEAHLLHDPGWVAPSRRAWSASLFPVSQPLAPTLTICPADIC